MIEEEELREAWAVPTTCPSCSAALKAVTGVGGAEFLCVGCSARWTHTLGWLRCVEAPRGGTPAP
jgi:hypothetical protein